MAATNPITEAELDEAFEDDSEFGFAILHEEFLHQIGRYIKSKAWGLCPHEIRGVYQETMREMVPLIRSPDFDSRGFLRIVYDIAHKRAIDALRRKKHRPKSDSDGAIQ